MFCARCDQPIQGKPDRYDHMSPSAAGHTVYLCPGGRCKPVRRQTAPVLRISRSVRRR